MAEAKKSDNPVWGRDSSAPFSRELFYERLPEGRVESSQGKRERIDAITFKGRRQKTSRKLVSRATYRTKDL